MRKRPFSFYDDVRRPSWWILLILVHQMCGSSFFVSGQNSPSKWTSFLSRARNLHSGKFVRTWQIKRGRIIHNGWWGQSHREVMWKIPENNDPRCWSWVFSSSAMVVVHGQLNFSTAFTSKAKCFGPDHSFSLLGFCFSDKKKEETVLAREMLDTSLLCILTNNSCSMRWPRVMAFIVVTRAHLCICRR